MAYGLKCLLTNSNQVQLIGAAMRNISDTIIAAKSDAKVTVRGMYNQLKKAGVDIDMESAAYIYADTFANDINQYANFETDEQLAEYTTKYPSVSKEVKQALIDAGYSKTLSSGTTILDWSKLMQKSEQEIKDEIKEQGLPNEDAIFNSLQTEWKQIISTALIKAKNDLSQRNQDDVTPSQRNAIDKIADLHARGLFTDFADTYQNAIHKAIVTSKETLGDLTDLKALSKTTRLLKNAKIGTNNAVGNQLARQINVIISKARFRNATGFYKIIKSVSVLYDMTSLAILGGLSNRGQNYFSGKAALGNSAINYGFANDEVGGLAFQTKRDIIRGEGGDFGSVSNMFNGDRSSSDLVRKFLSDMVGDEDEWGHRATNWVFNQLTGVAALNGVDNYVKVKNTWVRFVSGAEDILVSQGMDRKDAQKKLNEELFGDTWVKARERAKSIMVQIKQKGGDITINEQTIERFTADVVKAQLIENKVLTEDQLNGAWNGAYKSAGLEMGHVSNNLFTTGLNKLKEYQSKLIEDALSEGEYNKAAWLTLSDLFVSKMIFRFAGGGTNWLFLKLQKGGLGIVTGLASRAYNNSSFNKRDNLSSMSGADIEKTLFNIQKTNDQYARGAAGLIVNAALLLIAKAAYDCDRPECDKKKKEILNWMERNKWANKYVNNLVPWYLSAKIAAERQERMGGMKGLVNVHKYSPGRAYIYNFFNSQETTTTSALIESAGDLYSSKKSKQEEGLGKIGEVFGQYFNVDPIPYRVWKDVYTMYQGANANINQHFIAPKSIWEGYLKFGITDWPKLKTDKKGADY